MMQTPAVVMNMFYTGLGIARSLGSRGVPVFGLTSRKHHYGNYTRFARAIHAPDSRTNPDQLLDFLLAFGETFPQRPVLFPTRDDDVSFLNLHRTKLEPLYSLAIPSPMAIENCLDKWLTYQHAVESGVSAPRCWLIKSQADLLNILSEVPFPCVLKPLEAAHWRKNDSWKLVGGRKALAVHSPDELLNEYAAVSRADQTALLQELIPGDDTGLNIVACYLDRKSNLIAQFYTRKLIQVPPSFGTGCIVESAHFPELAEPTARLLKNMGFSGIAEVEYKWNNQLNQYQLIEVNARPWDQHRLGFACGVDLIYLSYCENAGLPLPPPVPKNATVKWIAEDTFVLEFARLLFHADPALKRLITAAKGSRIFAVWDARDPLPSVVLIFSGLLPELLRSVAVAVLKRLRRQSPPPASGEQLAIPFEKQFGNGESNG